MDIKRCKVCGQELHAGKIYCSRHCSSLDRWAIKRSRESNAPPEVKEVLAETYGRDEARHLLREAEHVFSTIALAKGIPERERSYGGYEAQTPDPFATTKKMSVRVSDVSWDHIEQMMRCGQVLFGLALKKGPVATVFRNSRSFQVEVKGEDKLFAEAVKSNLNELLPRIIHDFLTMLEYGVSFNEVVWKVDNNFPLVETINSIYPPTIDRINLKDGHFNGFTQIGRDGPDIDIPADQSLVLTYNKKFRNLWGESILRAVWPFYFWYDIIWRSFVRYLEKVGMPVVVATAPSNQRVNQREGGEAKRALDVAQELAFRVARSPAVALPSDVGAEGNRLWTLEYLKTTDNRQGEQFVQALELVGRMILRSILVADSVGAQEGGGTYNLGSIHYIVTMLDNERILSEITTQLSRYLLSKYGLYKRGVGHEGDVRLVTEGLNEEEKDKLFKILTMAINSKGEVLDAIDYREMAQVNNVPFLSEEEIEARRQADLKRRKEEMEVLTPMQEKVQQAKEQQAAVENAPVMLSTDEIASVQGL